MRILAGFLLLVSLFVQATALGQSASAGDPPPKKGPVLIARVHSDIESGISFFVLRMIRRAEKENAACLILEINSNGGLVTSAQEMKDALLRCKVPTVAYVRGRALSAAALIAISCEKIFMEPGSEMGAATPYKLLGSSVKVAEAKFVSAFRSEFESTAEARRRPKALAGAMVDKDHDEIPGLVKRGQILTFTSETAFQHGYCDQIVTSVESVLRRLNIEADPLEYVQPTSAEQLARWLTHPNVSVLLFTVGFWALILEFFIAGFGILGWLGITCLALFFGGHLFAYLAGLQAMLLFILGVVLLLLEFFVIPGFGVTGVGGILAVSASIILVFGGIHSAVWALAKIMALSIVLVVGTYSVGPKLHLFDRFVLNEKLSSEAGYVAVDNAAFDHLLNLEGITVSTLRPSGYIRIGGQKYEVVSDGEFIERKKRVVVVAVEGTKIVVRPVTS